VTNQFAGPYMGELHGRLDGLQISLEQSRHALGELRRDLSSLAGEVAMTKQVIRHLYEEVSANRRRLYRLRESPEYELSFTESEPLVSFVIPTHRRFESLRDVSLPSILGQTYQNVEIVVAGDGSPPDTESVISEFDDPRIRFHNRSVRGPYPDDESLRWYMIGTPPYNDGVAVARGRWIASLGDDDAVRPEHTEVLLEAAREHRHEHCYGRHQVHYPSGETLELGSFPPTKGEFVLQASLYHSGLRFFQMEPVDYLFEEPNDWSLCRRMLLAGVRFGMVDDIVADKNESRYQSHSDWSIRGVPSVE
jgi:glycosyltransferase involved in cell wall biosynthesis